MPQTLTGTEKERKLEESDEIGTMEVPAQCDGGTEKSNQCGTSSVKGLQTGGQLLWRTWVIDIFSQEERLFFQSGISQ